MPFPASLHIFCRVVDNFGDIGVCWRLARQLADEYGVRTTLWVDDLACFRKICREITPDAPVQWVQEVEVRRWREDHGAFTPSEVADIVIEAFACELPQSYVTAMAAREPKPVWLNLEYLSAEQWVESCHALPSVHPSLPLTKYFFFPGFSSRTGGLLREQALLAQRAQFEQDVHAVERYLARHGVRRLPGGRVISLFCYPHAPVANLLGALEQMAMPVSCLVPAGVASEAVGRFLGVPPTAGASASRGSLSLHVLPFVDQSEYDKLLWACDVNLVRGEDSFVRAQWAGKPFVWHIYPQEEGAHWNKMDAFLQRYLASVKPSAAALIEKNWRAWNGAAGLEPDWAAFFSALPELSRHAEEWSERLGQMDDLASNLLQFAREIS